MKKYGEAMNKGTKDDGANCDVNGGEKYDEDDGERYYEKDEGAEEGVRGAHREGNARQRGWFLGSSCSCTGFQNIWNQTAAREGGVRTEDCAVILISGDYFRLTC